MNQKCLQLLKKARNNPAGLKFDELRRLCRCAGMILDRTQASHIIYKLERPFYLLSIQKTKDGGAKGYQVRQLISFIEENNMDQLKRKD